MGASLRPIFGTIQVYCPDDGAVMILRRPNPLGNIFEPFFGCRNWPGCDKTLRAEYDEIERRWKPVDDYDVHWGWPGEL